MNKAFDLSLFCGRFQHIHIGHESVINTALKLSNRILILVGSSQEVGTQRNPFSVDTRIELIKAIYPEENVIVRPLADLTHENDITEEWGRYVLDKFKFFSHKLPEIMVYGNDECRSRWFNPDDIKSITEVIISRSKVNISATQMREYLRINDFDSWAEFANPFIHKYYDRLRSELLSCEFYKNRGEV